MNKLSIVLFLLISLSLFSSVLGCSDEESSPASMTESNVPVSPMLPPLDSAEPVPTSSPIPSKVVPLVPASIVDSTPTPEMNLEFAYVNKSIRAGDYITVVIQTVPHARCTIAASHSTMGTYAMSGLATKVTDEHGFVSWDLLINKNTQPGYIEITITADSGDQTSSITTRVTVKEAAVIASPEPTDDVPLITPAPPITWSEQKDGKITLYILIP